MFDTTERAGVDERYSVAGNTSDLTVDADRGGACDVIIAAGWNESRIGMALLRLHSEWGGLAKPKRATAAHIEAIAARIEQDDARSRTRWGPPDPSVAKPPHSLVRAKEEAEHWYANELCLLANGLKSRAVVWQQLLPWIAQNDIDPHFAAAALLHWLDPMCSHCGGHGFKKMPDAPALSNRQCNKCRGTGRTPSPHGTAWMIERLDYLVGVARGSLKRRLRPGD